MPEEIADLVASHHLLAGLPGDAVAQVAGCATNKAFAAGQLLFAEGQHADTLYLVRRGRVTLQMRSPGHRPLVLDTLGPGDAVGWSWLFPPYRWRLDARAAEPVGALSVDARCLREKAEADPVFGYAIMLRFASDILDRLFSAQVRLLDLYGGPRGAVPQTSASARASAGPS